MNFFKNIGASIKEFFRKKIVGLKRNPKIVPLVLLLIAFLFYSLNLNVISQTTSQCQVAVEKLDSNGEKIPIPTEYAGEVQQYEKQPMLMGLTMFAIMLLSVLSMVCILNAFPRRQKVNLPMLIVGAIMIGVVIYCDIRYNNLIDIYWDQGREYFPFIPKAYKAIRTHMILEIVGAAALVLMPVYTKLLGLINTRVDLEDNGNMDAIELSED